MVDETTNETEVEGSMVHVIHVDDSGTETVRTVLALAGRDDISLSTDEDEEDFQLAATRRKRRYRVGNTVDVEVASAIDVDTEAMELVGLVDADGTMSFATEDRRLRPEDDEYIEIAYGNYEGFAYADAELVHRLEDVELANPEVDMGSIPPIVSWTWWVHDAIHFAYTEPE